MTQYEVIVDNIHHHIECSSMKIDNGVLIFYENNVDETDDGDDNMRFISGPSIKKAFKLWDTVEKV